MIHLYVASNAGMHLKVSLRGMVFVVLNIVNEKVFYYINTFTQGLRYYEINMLGFVCMSKYNYIVFATANSFFIKI